jgi:hypothetical protein
MNMPPYRAGMSQSHKAKPLATTLIPFMNKIENRLANKDTQFIVLLTRVTFTETFTI